jgi:hypothetical protein
MYGKTYPTISRIVAEKTSVLSKKDGTEPWRTACWYSLQIVDKGGHSHEIEFSITWFITAFTDREEWERSIVGVVTDEWNTALFLGLLSRVETDGGIEEIGYPEAGSVVRSFVSEERPIKNYEHLTNVVAIKPELMVAHQLYIGIYGKKASGKSRIAMFAKRYNYQIVDSDDCPHQEIFRKAWSDHVPFGSVMSEYLVAYQTWIREKITDDKVLILSHFSGELVIHGSLTITIKLRSSMRTDETIMLRPRSEDPYDLAFGKFVAEYYERTSAPFQFTIGEVLLLLAL